MGHRLTKIYTRTGDDGTTGLGDGTRVAKTAPRIAAIGDVDELNSAVGLLLTEIRPGAMAELFKDVQHGLFDLGGELSVPGMTLVDGAYVVRLERAIDHWNAGLPPLKNFILPGGGRAAALCHVARAICRRAERAMTAVAAADGGAQVGAQGRIFLNRLSDLLFVVARVLARTRGSAEVLWEAGRIKKVTSHKSQVTRKRRKNSKRAAVKR